MVFDGLVYRSHQVDGLGEGGDGLLVVGEVFVGEGAALAVFQPLLADLIAADMELPHLRRDALEVLGGVDPDAAPSPSPSPLRGRGGTRGRPCPTIAIFERGPSPARGGTAPLQGERGPGCRSGVRGVGVTQICRVAPKSAQALRWRLSPSLSGKMMTRGEPLTAA